MFLSSYRPGAPEAMTIEQLWLTTLVKFILQFHANWLHLRNKKKGVPKICAEATTIFVAANRKWFSSLAAPCRVCSGATWLPRELSWKTHRWVIETLSCPSLIPSQTKSYSQKSSSVQSLRQVSLGSCAFLGAPPESAFKHEHIFNQARKSVKYKVHPALELQGTALSPWWRSPAGQFIPVAPKSSSLCAWLHFPSGREEQTSRKSCWLTDTQAPNARWIALFFFP